MKHSKQFPLLLIVVVMLFFSAKTFAQVCYDPYSGEYYNCFESAYYPNDDYYDDGGGFSFGFVTPLGNGGYYGHGHGGGHGGYGGGHGGGGRGGGGHHH